MDERLFTHYKYVYAVYEEGNITRAAQKLFISQPSLSAAIKTVEEALGAPLFDRTGTGVKPTQVGEEYIETCKRFLSAERGFFDRMHDLSELKTGSLSVGSTNYLSCYVLPRIIKRFSALYGQISISPIEAHSTELAAMIAEEKLDLVIDNIDENVQHYQSYPMRRERIFLCVPSAHPINEKLKEYRLLPHEIRKNGAASTPPVPLKAFAHEPFILLKSGNDMCQRAETIFRTAQIDPPVPFRVDQLNIAHAMAEAGVGSCFITDTLVLCGDLRDKVTLYNVDSSCSSRTLYIAHKKSRYCNHAMQAFLHLAQEEIKRSTDA